MGLLSDLTRIFRENGLSISAINIETSGERVVGSIYVMDASGNDVDRQTVELVIKEIGGSISVVQEPPNWTARPSSAREKQGIEVTRIEDKPRFSIGNLLWSQLERLSSNFGSIRS